MEDESIEKSEDDQKNKSASSLISAIDKALQSSMTSLIAAYKQTTSSQGKLAPLARALSARLTAESDLLGK